MHRISLFRHRPAVFLAVGLASLTGVASAQTTGNSAAGQQLFTTTLSPQCAGCHSTTNAGAANSLASVRASITNRAQPGGGAGTMNFAKALEAMDAALNGMSLGGATTAMDGFYTLTTVQRGDLAAYIANLPAQVPVVSYAPSGGPQFPATAVGSSASQTVTITNTGSAALTFATNNAVTIATGGDAADFRVTSSTCPGVTLQAGAGNCTISVTFQPLAGAATTRSASIGLAHNAGSGTSLVPMQGIVQTSVGTAPPTGSANAPSGGGGALSWIALLWLSVGLIAGRRR
jgi:hypothetical protein